MTPPRHVPDLPVLLDEHVWPEFLEAVRAVGETWAAPSGRTYRLRLDGERLEVFLVVDAPAPPPSGEELDVDLFELACEVHDRKGGAWSAGALRQTAALWGWTP